MSTRRPPVDRYAPITGRRAWMATRSDGARWHAGVDLAAPPGTPVRAPADGVVVRRMPDADRVPGWRGYGPAVVVVRDDDGAHHVLAHLAPDGLRVGASRVRAGDVVGRISALAHCHWEIRVTERPPPGVAVIEIAADPIAWLAGRVVRWNGRCPPAPGNTSRTPRACRPSWQGPPPSLPPWPTSARALAAAGCATRDGDRDDGAEEG